MNQKHLEPGTFSLYFIGFIISVFLTILAFLLVNLQVKSDHLLIEHGLLTAIVIGLALVQLMVQLIFFLHLGQESKPRWNLIMVISTAGVIFILVVGSLWIMNHLNYNMTPDQMNQQIINDEGLHY